MVSFDDNFQNPSLFLLLIWAIVIQTPLGLIINKNKEKTKGILVVVVKWLYYANLLLLLSFNHKGKTAFDFLGPKTQQLINGKYEIIVQWGVLLFFLS